VFVHELRPSVSIVALCLAGITGAAGALFTIAASRAILLDLPSQMAQIRENLTENFEQQVALINIRPLTGPLPLRWSSWAVEPAFAETILNELQERRPGIVLECGCGLSTLLVARCLEEIGEGRLISLEHDLTYASQARDLLERHGAGQNARVVVGDLVDYEVDGQMMKWYGEVPWEDFREGIDVLIVDGPPQTVGPRARYPAVPLLRGWLGPNPLILMDDGNRSSERWIANRWAENLNGRLEYVPTSRGAWILRAPPMP